MTDQVKDQVKETAQVAQEKARAATGQARGRLREQVDQRSTQAGERATGTAQDVRSVAEELRRQGKDTPARLADLAADRAEGVGRYLKGADADRLLADVEAAARKRPWVVVAGGLALGLAASRLLKASSGQRYRSSQDGGRGRSWSDDATTRAYPEPASEPLGAEAPPLAAGYHPEPTTIPRAPVETFEVPATEPVGTRGRLADPDPLP